MPKPPTVVKKFLLLFWLCILSLGSIKTQWEKACPLNFFSVSVDMRPLPPGIFG